MTRRAALSWTLLGLVVAVGLAVALWPRSGGAGPGPERRGPDPAAVAQQRAAAQLASCPTTPAAGTGALQEISLTCLADGSQVGMAAALGGRPALLNLWAYWCEPCARELPLLQRFADRASQVLTVLTVHSDSGEDRALARLAALGVRLPGLYDPDTRLRGTVGAPAVLPVSVLVRADGSVAKVVVRPFTDEADIAATVRAELGVAA